MNIKQRDAFAQIYSDYFFYIFNIAQRKLSNNFEDAEDICQEVFIKYYEKFDKIDNPKYWLLSTLRNIIRNHSRTKNKNESDNMDELLYDISLSYTNGFKDTRIIIQEAIDNSIESEQDRMIFDLIAVMQYNRKEVGEIMGLSTRQVGYRLEKTVSKINRYLAVEKGIDNMEELL